MVKAPFYRFLSDEAGGGRQAAPPDIDPGKYAADRRRSLQNPRAARNAEMGKTKRKVKIAARLAIPTAEENKIRPAQAA